jgi:hypothetical protein
MNFSSCRRRVQSFVEGPGSSINASPHLTPMVVAVRHLNAKPCDDLVLVTRRSRRSQAWARMRRTVVTCSKAAQNGMQQTAARPHADSSASGHHRHRPVLPQDDGAAIHAGGQRRGVCWQVRGGPGAAGVARFSGRCGGLSDSRSSLWLSAQIERTL